jgi:hypothetical protein
MINPPEGFTEQGERGPMPKRICLIAGQTVGLLGLVLNPTAVVTQSDAIAEAVLFKGFDIYHSIKDIEPRKFDAIVNVHGREYIPESVFSVTPTYNVHPYLYCYPGAEDPIGRAIKDSNMRASVGVHRVTAVIDKCPLVVEEYKQVDVSNRTRDEVYSELYPIYVSVLLTLKNHIEHS